MALPRTSWRRRPLLVLIILILLLAVGYTVRAFDGDSRTSPPTSSRPAGSQPAGIATQLTGTATQLAGIARSAAQPAQDGGRLAAKAAMPSCACGPAK